MTRCENTDLLVDQCAHCLKKLSIEEQATRERAQLTARDPRWFPAGYPGTCGNCGERFEPGTAIRFELGSSSNWIAECCAEDDTR